MKYKSQLNINGGVGRVFPANLWETQINTEPAPTLIKGFDPRLKSDDSVGAGSPWASISTKNLPKPALTYAQPIAPTAMINLLSQTIEQASVTADGLEATTQSKRIWNLP